MANRDADRAIVERANLYGLLAEIWRGPLSLVTLRALREPDFLSSLHNAGADPGDAFRQQPEDELLEALAVDYTQLFDGPRGHMPPYESVQRARDGGELNGEAAAHIRGFLADRGFRLTEQRDNLPDHIAVELEIMAALLQLEADAWRAGDREAVQQCRDDQRAFFVAHPGGWGPEFGRRIEARAETTFYQAVGRLLTGFLEVEASELSGSGADHTEPLPGPAPPADA
jgi:putative dimethyl sulfoxide reductase chaperone